MKRIYASVLITNFNKEKFLKKTLNSCKNQNFKDKEVIIFDDCSTDNSLSVIKKFKNFKLIKNKKKKFKSAPLNQIYAISKLIKFSKGEIIFFLDSDDEFKKDKISEICKLFKKNKKLNFVQDTPINSSTKKKLFLKKRRGIYTIWPRFFPTSTIVVRKSYFKNFQRLVLPSRFPNLEIDARISIYTHLKNEFFFIKNSYTTYKTDTNGITSNYKKYRKKWWIKRMEAFNYMMYLSKKFKIEFKKGPDFYLTRLINFFLVLK